MKRTFKKFIEAADIFGFESSRHKNSPDEYSEMENYPIRQFDVELMMNLLLRKKLGLHEADYSGFSNEITWGNRRPGAIKLEVDTGYTFYIKRLNYDLEGQQRWITKKMFQLNRRGLAGYEDVIANEIYEHIQRINELEVDYPKPEYKDLEKLTWKITTKMRKVADPMFYFRGIKKLSEQCYHIILELRAGGVETQDQHRVEQNITQVSYDEHTGTIRVNNYNLESPTGGNRSFEIMPNDVDLYFYPSQTLDEIADTMAVHIKYY